MLDGASAEPREPGLPGGGEVVGARRHEVVVVVGDRPAPVGMEAERERRGHVGLEVEHEVTPDQAGGVGDAAAQQQPWCLEGATGEHDVGRRHLVAVACGVEVAHGAGAPPRAVKDDLGGHGTGPDLAAAAAQGPAQRCHRVSLGVDRTAVLPTEPAVVAGGPVVIVHRVDARRCPIGVIAQTGRGLGGEDGPVHVRPRAHGVWPRAPGLEGVDASLAGHSDETLGFGVAGLELAVIEGPVGEVRSVDRASLRQEAEIHLAEPGHLGVGVHGPSSDARREVVDLADQEMVAVVLGPPKGPWLEERVRTEEVPARELDLVVGEVPPESVRRLEVEQVVAPLLQHDDAPAGGGEDVGGRGPARSTANDDGVGVAVAALHGSDTSASVQPLGWTSPSNAIDLHPMRSRLPPYSGGPYIASQACS